jgi:hypothetical protein
VLASLKKQDCVSAGLQPCPGPGKSGMNSDESERTGVELRGIITVVCTF